ncbi:MAG: structural protein P5 [Prevotellaceae bacterium]|nr:structural protein P5 [Prevotellaceae bacterium]
MTRGQRNHNPLNIRLSKGTRWLGQCTRQYDREFVQFQSDLFGFRAAFRIMRTYIRLHHLHTLRLIIYRWAPPEDGNNTETYLATVSERSRVPAGKQLTFEDEDELIEIVAAMALVESRMADIDRELLRKAYRLAM